MHKQKLNKKNSSIRKHFIISALDSLSHRKQNIRQYITDCLYMSECGHWLDKIVKLVINVTVQKLL